MLRNGLPLMLALASACGYLVWLTAAWGVGGTPDSANYLAAAQDFAQEGSLHITGQRELLWWPPLYPVSWGLALKAGLDPFDAALGLNLLSLMAFAWGWYKLCFRIMVPIWAWIAWVTLVLSLAPMRIFAQALSEPGFLAISIWALYCQIRAQSDPHRRWLVLAITLTALACMWRYLGVVLIVTGAVGLYLNPNLKQRRLFHLITWFVPTCAPLGIWLFRNWWVSGTMTGVRPKAALGIWGNCQALATAAYHWLFNQNNLTWGPPSLLAFTGMCLIFVLLWSCRSSFRTDLKTTLKQPHFLLPLCYVLVYFALFLFLASTTLTTRPNTRLLAPMAPPAVFCGFLFLHQLVNRLSKQAASLWTRLFSLFAACLVVYGGLVAAEERRQGWGARNRLWQTSPMFAWIETHGKDIPIYSNMRQELYLNTMHEAAGLPRTKQQLERLAIRLRKTHVLVAWSKLPAKGRRPYSWEDVRSLFPSQHVREWEDGWILQINPSHAHPAHQTQ